MGCEGQCRALGENIPSWDLEVLSEDRKGRMDAWGRGDGDRVRGGGMGGAIERRR